jgi:hypothetical protein
LEVVADQRETITRWRLAELLDQEGDAAAQTAVKLAGDAANDIRAGDDQRKVIYPNIAWGGLRSRRNVELFQRVKHGEVRVVDD